jgi:hypothetical protein
MFAVTSCLVCLALIGPGQGGADLHTIQEQAFQIPFQLDPGRGSEVAQVFLFVSHNKGKTWKKVATATPQEKGFRFQAPKDGTYWFTVQTRDKKGRLDPADLSNVTPSLKVVVQTGKKQPGPPTDAIPSDYPPGTPSTGELANEVRVLRASVKELEKLVEMLQEKKRQRLEQEKRSLQEKVQSLQKLINQLKRELEDESAPVSPPVTSW